MRFIFFLILSLGWNVSFGQMWTQIGNTPIEYRSLVNETDTLYLFKKNTEVIAVPTTMSADFKQLFLQDPYSFDIINDSCLHLRTFMMDESVQSILNPFGIDYLVYFISREIKKFTDTETWSLINLYGQGQHCWPGIVIRRSKSLIDPIIFLAVIRGVCEI
jgi:hypothetical protein